jgi:hypothetical protein
MTSRDTTAFGRRLTALAIAVGLGLGVSACSGGGRDQDRPAAAASEAGGGSAPHEQLQTDTPLAELQGQGGLSLTITSAKRDPAGYVTVRGDLKNDASTVAVVPAELRGDELQVLRTGPSLGGDPRRLRPQGVLVLAHSGLTRSVRLGEHVLAMCGSDERRHRTTNRHPVPEVIGYVPSCTSELTYQAGKLTGICVTLRSRKCITAARPGRDSRPPHVGGRGRWSTAPRRTGRQRETSHTSDPTSCSLPKSAKRAYRPDAYRMYGTRPSRLWFLE